VKILLILNTPGFMRYYDETIEALLARGHEVVLGFTDPRLRPEALAVLEDRERCPEVIGGVPRRADRYAPAADLLRTLVDFVRYLDPRFARAQWLRDRRRVALLDSPSLARLLGGRDTLPAPVVRVLVAALLACERALPSAPAVEALLRDVAPDVVLVSPLVTGGSPQTDYVKSARALGLPTGLCVASWDNLTNKGLMRVVPDTVMVWNEAQRREAVELHGVAPDRVRVTGAQPFDRWFGRSPTASRELFCRRVGLDSDRPVITFVGSTSNITDAGAEDRFERAWIDALRAARDPVLAGAGLLVRPHPDRRGAWTTLDLDEVSQAVVWPPRRPNSVVPSARDEYFDSLFHSSAIVGINTSAMVEGAIVGRPVLTVRLPEFEQAQAGTLHFDHLLPEHGGPLFAAGSLAEHARELAALLADPSPARVRNTAFVATFIRPHGIETASTPRLVSAIEALDGAPVRSERGAAWLRPMLLAAAVAERRRARSGAPGEGLARVRARSLRVEAGFRAAAVRAEAVPPAAATLLRAAALVRAYRRRRVVALKRRAAAEKTRRGERRLTSMRALKRRPDA